MDNAAEIVQVDGNSPMAYRQSKQSDDLSLSACNSNDPFDKCMQECNV